MLGFCRLRFAHGPPSVKRRADHCAGHDEDTARQLARRPVLGELKIEHVLLCRLEYAQRTSIISRLPKYMWYAHGHQLATVNAMSIFRRIYRRGFAPLALLGLIFLTACSAGDKKELAEQSVSLFHAQLNAGQYHAIYI